MKAYLNILFLTLVFSTISYADNAENSAPVTIGGSQEGAQAEGFMAMFVGDLYSNFRNIEKFTAMSKIAAIKAATPLLKKEINLDFKTDFLGRQTDINSFLEVSSTSSFLVLKDGKIIYENYRHGDSENSLHVSFSVAKSFVATLVGIAVDEGLIKDVNDPIQQYLPELTSATFDGVTVKHVLQMSSGVKFNEDYTDPDSDINKMTAIVENISYLEYINTLDREHKPGTFNHYASINTQLLGLLVQRVSKTSLTDYMVEKLWRPMKMRNSAGWVLDNQGNELAMGGLIASARDYARLGMLYLNNGMAHGKQIVSRSWVTASVTPNEEHLMPGSENSSSPSGYMYQWWVPRNPDGDFLARGIWGQQLYVHPTNRIVIVRLSADQKSFDKEFKLASIDYIQALAQSLTN